MKLNVTYCSGKKTSGIHPPERLYVSKRISRFIDVCKNTNSEWAIFSALYGLFFPNEKKPEYNYTFKTDYSYPLGVAVIKNGGKLPKKESKAHIENLSIELKKQAEFRRIEKIVFYGPSPKMMKCYLTVLHYAFDGCQESHDWSTLLEHVKSKSKMIKVVHRVEYLKNF
jgi:hypothetical protein